MRPMLEALEVSGVATFQDLGRSGYQQYGLPVSGALDWFAYQIVNRLLHNSQNAVVLEIGLGEIVLQAKRDCALAVTGAGFEVQNYVWTFPLWTSFYVRAGWTVRIKKIGGGNWAYLGIAGGFKTPQVLGSASAYLRGGMGRLIQAGDILESGTPSAELSKLVARNFAPQAAMPYSQTPTLGVIPGPQRARFNHTFFETEYTVSQSFDRMGYRLAGPAVQALDQTELISEGMTTGSIQITPQGQPIVMLADAPTTGGYPKIANVITADLPILAQCEAGISRIRFKEVSLEEAQAKYKALAQTAAKPC
ncbi:MAG: biotin-dependent carboxyltransferase [Anaerolineales bacterium]|nr:biotin-dependent carboxyltransferase [Anaerolineales bacterium]